MYVHKNIFKEKILVFFYSLKQTRQLQQIGYPLNFYLFLSCNVVKLIYLWLVIVDLRYVFTCFMLDEL